ncbi:MAG: insulinase family protein [candidate division Zixibacteria bacterium]|jgi:predicted Zn-dependent peptidase|nr:insulinase family protein [candidate division Zixibacteria bacterium]
MKILIPGLLALLLISPPAVPTDDIRLDVKELTLENGMRFLVLERHESPVFSVVLRYKVGSVDERPGITGMAHLCEHMMFKGTKLFGTTDYEAELPYLRKIDSLAELLTIEQARERNPFYKGSKDKVDSLKAEIHKVQLEETRYIIKDELWETYLRNGGTMLNASTFSDGTQYFVSLPANRLELWALLESDRMANLVTREYYSERDVVYEERRLRTDNDPSGYLEEQFNAAAFTACGYSWPVIGWASDLETMTRLDLNEFRDKFYAPNNAVVAIVGDVEFDEVKYIAEKYFGPIPPSTGLPKIATIEPPQKGERRVKVKFDAEPQALIGYHTVAAGDPDLAPLEIMASILTDGRTSRLHKKMVENLKIAQSIGCGVSSSRYPDMFMFWLTPMGDATLEANENAIYAEIENMKTQPVSDWELQRVRNQLDANYIRMLRSNMWMAFSLSGNDALTGDWRYIKNHYWERKAVTKEDIMRVAKKYFTEDNRTVAYIVKTPGAQMPARPQAVRPRVKGGY